MLLYFALHYSVSLRLFLFYFMLLCITLFCFVLRDFCCYFVLCYFGLRNCVSVLLCVRLLVLLHCVTLLYVALLCVELLRVVLLRPPHTICSVSSVTQPHCLMPHLHSTVIKVASQIEQLLSLIDSLLDSTT